MERNEVFTSLEIVLEEIEVVVDNLNQDGSAAFQKGDYATAQNLIEIATRITDFRGKVRGMQKEWDTLFSTRVRRRTDKPGKRKTTSRLERGLRTPEDSFRLPLLETLIEEGGSGAVSEILDTVGEKLKDVLNEYDRQPLPSNLNTTRWSNKAQWCRNTMVQEGLMKSDSPRGIWEISSVGREAVNRGDVH